MSNEQTPEQTPQPGAAQPGAAQPGATQPGAAQPGAPQPQRRPSGSAPPWPTADEPARPSSPAQSSGHAAPDRQWDRSGDPVVQRPGAPASSAGQVGQPSDGQPSHGQPSHGQPSHGQPSHGQPSYGGGWRVPPQPQPSPAPRARRRGGLLAGVTAIGVVALGGAGIVGYRLWDQVNGSPTPVDAARQAVEGLAEGDLLAAAGTIVPAERRGLDDVARRFVELAGEAEGDEMAALEDVEVDLAGLELTPTPLGELGVVAMVELGGEVEVTFDRDAIDDDSVIDALESLLGPAGGDIDLDDVLDAVDEETDGVLAFGDGSATLDLDRFARVTDVTPWVVAVDDGSGWYLSPSMTLFDLVAFADPEPPGRARCRPRRRRVRRLPAGRRRHRRRREPAGGGAGPR